MIARLVAYFFVGLLCAVGPLLIVIAIVSSVPTAEFVLASTATDGRIVSLDRVYYRFRYGYLPVFRFTANDGQTHMVRADSSTNWVRFKPGDRIRVLYINGRPESARIDSIPQLWMPQLILAILGALFTTVPVRIWMRKRTLSRAPIATDRNQ
ncbi:DUF3592 domain-containing protein [Telmatobacter sp. DSM 110680]|uniref:DUF3592 domain-containing protein n=1 Tax=Telmatobacter sp. DSM 110680 TaxID=3036704 RepID=A0AAU7DRT4_9BACT